MIFFLIIFIILLVYIYNINNDEIIDDKKEIVKTIPIKKIDEYYYDSNPAFRGLAQNVHMLYKYEKGGSKPFKKIILNNSNLDNNKIAYKLYSSYRIKPFTCV